MKFRAARLASMCFVVLAFILVLPTRTARAEDQGVLGYWKHVDESSGQIQSIFRLFESGGKVQGRIEKIFPTPGKKTQTICSACSGAQKNKPVVGLTFVWDLVRDQGNGGKWIDGKILNPEDGKVYNAEAQLTDNGQTLKMFGYIKVLVKVGGTSVWHRPTAAELEGL